MSYAINKARARTVTTKPSLTDQSQARETDINVIVGRFLKTGTAPGGKPPIYGDFTQLDGDLREMIERARTLHKERAKLPKELQNLPIEELLALSPDKLKDILTPPAPSPADKPADKPEETK